MISFIIFMVFMGGCFTILTSLIFYGDKVIRAGDTFDRYLATKISNGLHYQERKKAATALARENAVREWHQAWMMERIEHRKQKDMVDAQNIVEWERKFYGDAPLPSDVQQLAATAAKYYALPEPKRPLIGETIIPKPNTVPASVIPDVMESDLDAYVRLTAPYRESDQWRRTQQGKRPIPPPGPSNDIIDVRLAGPMTR